MNCRFCKSKLKIKFLDLGYSPLANDYPVTKIYNRKEKFYPLKTWFCEKCFLVQSQGFNKTSLLFNDKYTYFSSVSKSFSEHFKNYVIKITKLLKLNKNSFIIEIGSNDGILLKNFKNLKKNCLGIEPSKNTAKVCEKFGIKVVKKFFNFKLATSLSSKKADLIIANNVFAHIPKINDTVKGLKKLLNREGCINIEFPHLLNLIKFKQFDTVYHEHFFYFSLTSVINIFNKYNLKIWKVDKVDTHGGSLRIYASHADDVKKVQNSVNNILSEEEKFGITKIITYKKFQEKIKLNKIKILKYLEIEKKKKKKICGFGAPAKATTLINYYKLNENTLGAVFDNSPSKIGKYIPGTNIPIIKPTEKNLKKFDIIFIFAWNLKKEIINFIRNKIRKNIKIGILIPKLKILKL
tara:strand:+ start:21603 stop:22826 length:1224 start_codon:yes stop_codon:yes gene_type:complete